MEAAEQRVRDPAHNLSRIKQAIYILRCISDGRTRNDIVENFDSDEQLVSIWINYLKERNYLNASSEVTDEGHSFLRNFINSSASEITT
ncbi:MAG: hypothetical protein WA364_24715 [Candidatus Nitrosopolaris sp.]|jgi:hypothetical protein